VEGHEGGVEATGAGLHDMNRDQRDDVGNATDHMCDIRHGDCMCKEEAHLLAHGLAVSQLHG
jgi:hypothetical protein